MTSFLKKALLRPVLGERMSCTRKIGRERYEYERVEEDSIEFMKQKKLAKIRTKLK
jgi:hypothetical protein